MANSKIRSNHVRRVKLEFAVAAYKIIQDQGLISEFERRIGATKARLGSVLTQARNVGLDTSAISNSSVLSQSVSRGLEVMIERGFTEALEGNDKARISVDKTWVAEFITLSKEHNLRQQYEFARKAEDECDRKDPYDCPSA